MEITHLEYSYAFRSFKLTLGLGFQEFHFRAEDQSAVVSYLYSFESIAQSLLQPLEKRREIGLTFLLSTLDAYPDPWYSERGPFGRKFMKF